MVPLFISRGKCGPADLRTTTQQDVGRNDDNSNVKQLMTQIILLECYDIQL